MRVISAITKAEFLQAFQRCTPPTGWNSKLAVANSGGPDSTCLLFLVHRMLSDQKSEANGLPPSVISLTVDHQLQPASTAMAKRCANIAESFGVEHLVDPIQWGQKPFPPKPLDTESFERIARDARYHILFNAMNRAGAKSLAFGHHVDDQLETSLMRLARGTTEIGAGGMRRIRRWGMGFGRGPKDLAWAGYAGMSRWILRPLLEFSKDRILATCEEHGLEYVVDETNFQPELTLRNAVRQMLTEEDMNANECLSILNNKTLPDDIKNKLVGIHEATQSLRSVYYDISGGREQLQGAVKVLSLRVEDVDSEVTSHLKRRTLPSPPSTFLLSIHNLSAIRDETIRSAIVLRIMRYVSFHPWGSVRADGNRRRDSIQQIVSKIWHPNPFSANISPFVAGGGVMWTPVGITDGKIQLPETVRRFCKIPHKIAWLASRQPPLSKSTYMSKGIDNPLLEEVTEALRQKLKETTSNKVLDVLWDSRFLISFKVDLMPTKVMESIMTEGSTIRIDFETRWLLPKVSWRNCAGLTTTLASVSNEKRGQPVRSPWISMTWIRVLDAT